MAPDLLSLAAKGKRGLLATLISRAQVDPDQIYGSFPLQLNIDNRFRDFTFGEMASAVDACAWFIKEQFGTSTDFEPLLYMGVGDFGYALLMFAAHKCGFKLLCLSPMNTVSTNVVLLEKTRCRKALYSVKLKGVLEQMHTLKPEMEIAELKPFLDWLDTKSQAFPYHDKSWKCSQWDPFAVYHSSGSTGLPKPISLPNGWFGTADHAWRAIEDQKPILMDNFHSGTEGGFILSLVPPFFAAGGELQVLPTFSQNGATLIGAPDVHGSSLGPMALKMMMIKSVKALYCTPTVAEQISTLVSGMEALKRLESLLMLGGVVSADLSRQLESASVRLAQIYGSTELGILPLITSTPGESEYIHVHPDLRPTWEPTGFNDACELVFKDAGEETNRLRGTFWSMPTEKEWRTKDMFVPHPSKEGLWKYHGRTDDLIHLSSGKINPLPMEVIIKGHAEVSDAFVTAMGGERRPCALIEPHDQRDGPASDMTESMWSIVEKANALVPAWGQLLPSLVTIVPPGSFARAPKGTIVRNRTAEKLHGVIEKLYRMPEAEIPGTSK